ncbi:HAD hydrolase-like protein [Gordonia phthalatica]|uniref:HAD family hydrolase n=1 Tax=Gordonia phthalatica TaxID=1136941 RepID=A0A0N9N841_9ACTN|nr:HAD hydrolase-like protein [Gordonia phthalatica]ALG86874.1 HAD family hydrolase [Gordonia phthalatica]
MNRVSLALDPTTALLFDLDGTITDSYDGITRSYVHAFTEIGVEPPSAEALRGVVGPPLRVSMRQFGLTDDQVSAAIAAYRERYLSVGWLENRVFDGMADLLADLALSGRTMAITTSKDEAIARRIVDNFGLTRYFAVVAGAGDDGTRPTKADVIAHALGVLQSTVNPSQAVMIGDRSHDVEGAAAHGIPTIGVRWGYALPGELETAQAQVPGAAGAAGMGTAQAEWIVDSVQRLREELGV